MVREEGFGVNNKKMNLDNAAYEVFSEYGYKNTNISEIAKKAGMAVGSFYKYYKSKEEIFLETYIKENERVRKQLIDKVHWNGKPVDVVDELFTYTLEYILNNKILAEWSNPIISEVLHKYYYSEAGTTNYTFHQFLLNIFQERLNQEEYDLDLTNKILKVFDFVYYIDCHITDKDFEDYSETLRILVKYFIKGVFS